MIRTIAPLVPLLAILLGATTMPAPTTAPVPDVRDIEYAKSDGISQKLDAFVPTGPGPFPIALIVHGGGWGSGDKEKDITPLFEPLKNAGFVVFTINYRLAPAYRWPDCYEDVKTAIHWAKTHAAEFHADPKRLALIGYSAGGHLAFLAATQATGDDTVQALVGLSPPTDLELDLPQRGGLSLSLQHLLNRPHELTPDARQQLHEMSPINYIHPGLPPVLLLHGTADKSVLFQDSINLQAKLKSVGVECDLITLQGAPHNINYWLKFDPDYPWEITHWLKGKLVSSK